MINISNLFFSFAKEYYTLHDINFKLKKGDGAIIIGDKDSGKTSLVRLLLGLEKPNSGTILLNNVSIDKVDFKNDLSLGYIPQTPPFIAGKSVEYNLKYIIKLRTKNKELVDVKVRNTLISYNLFAIKNVKIDHLNYYDKIMLSIARLSTRPIDLLIVDDIFSGLNEKELAEVVKSLKNLIKQNNCTVLILMSDKKYASLFKYDSKYLKSGSLCDEEVDLDDWY